MNENPIQNIGLRTMASQGRGWDDLCAYKTDVKVLIRHKTVGCLYYACMLAILGGYVIGYEYVVKEGWGNVVPFAGSLRATCKAPYLSAPIDDLPYCSQAASPPRPSSIAIRYPCMSKDDEHTSRVSSMGVLVGTRLSRIHQEVNPECGELDYGCQRWMQTRRIDAFVGDVESHTVLVQHAVAPVFIKKMGGREVIDTFHNRSSPEVRGPDGSVRAIACRGRRDPEPVCPDAGDLIFVRDLIKVSGVELDGPVPGLDGQPDVSLRSEGLTMRVNLDYEGEP